MSNSGRVLRTETRADLDQSRCAPKERKVTALLRFDRLDATGVVRLQEDTRAVFAFNERKIVAVPRQARVCLGKCVNIEVEKCRNGFRFAGLQDDVTRCPAAGTALSATEARRINQHGALSLPQWLRARSLRPPPCWPAPHARASAYRQARRSAGGALDPDLWLV